jgi:hypothetical protein
LRTRACRTLAAGGVIIARGGGSNDRALRDLLKFPGFAEIITTRAAAVEGS